MRIACVPVGTGLSEAKSAEVAVELQVEHCPEQFYKRDT